MSDTTTPDPLSLARTLLRGTESGILSTLSVELDGYPFGSVTPFVTSDCGKPVIYVSDIAQHTANMDADSKVCLSVQQSGAGNQQELGRVTLIGDARRVPDDSVEAIQERYYTFFPQARHYGQAHAFSFYWIEPVRVRYIRGFGQIFWIEKGDWNSAAPDWHAQEAGMIEHMNQDHADAMGRIVQHQSGTETGEVLMLSIDTNGCHMRADGQVHYLAFEQPCLTATEVREALVAMAKAA
ncbi:MAG: putative heme iron utilization protein [Chlamydiales bacterium]|jgi:putative heme iron utilization protein